MTLLVFRSGNKFGSVGFSRVVGIFGQFGRDSVGNFFINKVLSEFGRSGIFCVGTALILTFNPSSEWKFSSSTTCADMAALREETGAVIAEPRIILSLNTRIVKECLAETV